MDTAHLAWAQAQLKTRELWLTQRKHCEYDLLLGIEQKLYGHLCYLQEAITEPDLSDEENRALNLCIFAFRPDFREAPDHLAAQLLETGVEPWLEDLQTAIDITGAQNWQPLLHTLIEQTDLTDPTHWWLKSRLHDVPPAVDSDVSHVSWSQAIPGQIPCLVKSRAWKSDTVFDTWISEARDSVQNDDRQEDLHWLALGLLATDKQPAAIDLIQRWITASSDSRYAWRTAAASGASEFIQPLQQAVLDEHIPPFWLVVHGDAAHLDFCVDLLSKPHTNPLAERAWYGFTGERLPRVPVIKLGTKEKGDRLADATTARQWLDVNQPTGRLCLGHDHSDRPFRPQLGRFFGADTEPVTSAIWLDTQGGTLLSPTECHWQRAQRLQEARA